jgi:hypothetical protein
MKRSETAALLAKCAAYDQRTIGEADVEAWAEALDCPWVPNIGLEEALATVAAHYRATGRRIAPADVLQLVKEARALEASRLLPQGHGVPPTDEFRQALSGLKERVAATTERLTGAEAARVQHEQFRKEQQAQRDGSTS